jgi:hypothetical protein
MSYKTMHLTIVSYFTKIYYHAKLHNQQSALLTSLYTEVSTAAMLILMPGNLRCTTSTNI